MIEIYKGIPNSTDVELVELFEDEEIEAAKAYADDGFETTGEPFWFDYPNNSKIRYFADDIPF